jgi:hypothetical protein
LLVGASLGHQDHRSARAAGAELDADLRLRSEPRFSDLLGQAHEVVVGDRNETCGDLDDVEPEIFALGEVSIHRASALGEYVLEESAGRDRYGVAMAYIDDAANDTPRHQRERSACELERVNVVAHLLEDVFEIARAGRRVVRAAHLGHAARAGFALTLVDPQEREGSLVFGGVHGPSRARAGGAPPLMADPTGVPGMPQPT